MPDFEIVSVQDAKLKTLSGRQRTYMNEYAGYIQQLSPGMAGKIRPLEDEKLTTIRRRLVVTAQMLDVPLVIRRSGYDLYFWSEPAGESNPDGEPPDDVSRKRKLQHKISL